MEENSKTYFIPVGDVKEVLNGKTLLIDTLVSAGYEVREPVLCNNSYVRDIFRDGKCVGAIESDSVIHVFFDYRMHGRTLDKLLAEWTLPEGKGES